MSLEVKCTGTFLRVKLRMLVASRKDAKMRPSIVVSPQACGEAPEISRHSKCGKVARAFPRSSKSTHGARQSSSLVTCAPHKVRKNDATDLSPFARMVVRQVRFRNARKRPHEGLLHAWWLALSMHSATVLSCGRRERCKRARGLSGTSAFSNVVRYRRRDIVPDSSSRRNVRTPGGHWLNFNS